MKNGIVIADSGPIFSLAVINKLEILEEIFDEVRIPEAVWEEITLLKDTPFYHTIKQFFNNKINTIKSFNDLTFIMDYGESESVILYKELKANFLLIDDKKARDIAENLDINCIGTLGILSSAKQKGLIKELKPLFKILLQNRRYYSLKLINLVLENNNEITIS